MEIEQLNLNNDHTANEILTVQCPAYQEEAQIIGFDGIPHLKDTIESIQSCHETFLGCKENGKLVGFLAYEDEQDKYQITRLCVVPSHFRKGVASKLIDQFLSTIDHSTPVHVHTGSLNTPALHLYQRFGFVHDRIDEAEPGVWLQYLVKH